MLVAIEKAILETAPNMVVVFGDTNSTLSGALAAVKLHVPVAHIEAGLRSYNRQMPEEVNRVMVDYVSTLLFCPSEADVGRLGKEGLVNGIFEVGDVMKDAIRLFLPIALKRDEVLARRGLKPGEYAVATLHRPSNVDTPGNAPKILDELDGIGLPVVLPIHPRLRKAIGERRYENLILEEPLGYLDMMKLCHDAEIVITDSGGLQKEAYWLRTPCLTLRTESEWTEILETGWGALVDPESENIAAAFARRSRPETHPELYGDAHASERIVSSIEDWLAR